MVSITYRRVFDTFRQQMSSLVSVYDVSLFLSSRSSQQIQPIHGFVERHNFFLREPLGDSILSALLRFLSFLLVNQNHSQSIIENKNR